MIRVGMGQDSHQFSKDENKKLFLGGIEIEGEIGLEGNSDADVVIHAICRAIEQALGSPDFDIYSDKMCKTGVTDSREYLKVAVRNMEIKAYVINNIGISFECKKPKIFPLTEKIKKSLATILKVGREQIGISASTGEGLTSFGRGEGIQVFVIVSLIKNEKS